MRNARSAATSVLPAISFGQECHPGLKREDNQDSIVHVQTPHGELFVVADGVGGYYGGGEASEIVTSGFPRHLQAIPTTMPAEAVMTEAVRRLNAEVFAAGQSGDQNRRRMSSTVVAALLTQRAGETEAVIGNVGDSRAYLIRGRRITQLSTDHTAVQGMINAGVLMPEQALGHPNSSVLTRTLGQTSEVTMDIKRVALQSEDQILLCSDGLHGFAEPGEMLAVLTSPQLTPSAHAKALLDLALSAGGPDNISVQVVRLAGNGAATMPRLPASRNRTITFALVGAAAILIASVVGVLGYKFWQDKPISSTVPKAVHIWASVQSALSHKRAEQGAANVASTVAAPARPATKPVLVGGLKPLEEPDLERYSTYKKQIGYAISDVDAKHQVGCERLAGKEDVAYYRTNTIVSEPPTSDPTIRENFRLEQSTAKIDQACGMFDLLLVTRRTTPRKALSGRLSEDAVETVDRGENAIGNVVRKRLKQTPQ